MTPTPKLAATVRRATRPLYLKKVPTEVWEQVHINAIRSGMRLTEYLVSIMAAANAFTPAREGSEPLNSTTATTSSPPNANV